MAKHILLINGPNLSLLGLREPHIYGSTTLSTLHTQLTTHCATLSPAIHLSTFQSNHEGAIIDVLHSCHPAQYTFIPNTIGKTDSATVPKVDAIIINPGGLTHTSVALRDALVGVSIPFVEVHISNVYAREEFRHRSFLSEKAVGVICGLGVYGYVAAVDFFAGKGMRD